MASVVLGIVARFHYIGSLPERIERLNSLVIIGVIEAAVNFNIFEDIPSDPLALVTSTVFFYNTSDATKYYDNTKVYMI